MQSSFLQSQGWEKFQKSVGYKTFRVDGALLIKKPLGFGKSYFYSPRIQVTSNKEQVTNFFDKIKELAKKEKSIFVRIEPQEQLSIINYELRKVNDIQPSQTIVFNLEKNEDELLAQMHQKTRYNIRLAEKKSVKIQEGKESEFEKFWSLIQETVRRNEFRSHSKEYYRKMLNAVDISIPTTPTPSSKEGSDDGKFSDNKFDIKLYFAEYENKTLAAGIFVFYQNTVTYLHGASTHEHKEVMAPYLLHWEVIKFAKKAGYKYYDFYGIDEKKWPGVTRFKRGFGGIEISYPGAYDFIFSHLWFFLYKVFKRVKRIV